MEKRLIGIKEIADYLNRSPRTIKRYIKDKSLPVVKVGGVYETEKGQVNDWRNTFM